jgi:hypothetical protein
MSRSEGAGATQSSETIVGSSLGADSGSIAVLAFTYVASISISTSLAILSRVRSPELEM